METKIIKEEIPEKEFSEADRTASLRSRTKGSTSTNKPITNDRTTCKAPDSPEGARLSATSQQTPTSQNVSSQNSNQNNTAAHNLVTRSSQSPNPAMAQHSPPSSRVSGGVNGSSSPVHGGSPDNTVTTPPLSLTLDSSHAVSANPAHSTGQYLNYSPANTLGSFRQLNKVKRFLCTLVQFGADIGPEIGDRVRSLVLSLVSSNLSIEEFHQALQEVTNFPLRPFVLPFLRTHLPLLQREIQSLARASKQSSLQYVRTHEHLVLDPTFSPSEASEIFLATDPPVVTHKRRASDSFYENGITANGHSANASLTTAMNQHETNEYASPPNKRQMTHHQNPFLLSTTTGVQAHPSFFLPNLGNIALTNLQNLHYENYAQNYNNVHANQPQLNVTSTSNRTVEGDNSEMASSNFQNKFSLNFSTSNNRGDEEWKNIHVMLNCILSMVEKTKRALSILQQRNSQDQTTDWLRKQDIGVDLKKAANEIMIQAIRQTEDRVAEVKRKAEEAVQEVKKQAVIELQKAVQLAEAKASELVASERAKMEKVLLEVRKPGNDEVLQAHHTDGHDSSQSPPISSQTPTSSQNSCWNCGRKANETCSGCNVARYCGAFCQHKDWENHHSVCGQQQSGNKQNSLVPLGSNNSAKHQTSSNAVCSTVKSHSGGSVLNSTAITRENGKSSRSSSDNSGSSRGNTPVSSTNLNQNITATANSTVRRSERDVDRATSLIAK